MSISYGSYSFPNPLPFVAFADEPIYLGGQLDQTLQRITLVGKITGANISGLSVAKKSMISGLLSEFQTLQISGDSFAYCKPTNISFSENDMTRILPYSVEFERFNELDFSEYFGITNPTNTWNYQEQEGRVVSASHTVSAQGVKTSTSEPMDNAKSFVSGLLTGFRNLSVVNPTGFAFLQSKAESIDRFANSYSVTENYVFSTSREPLYYSGIVTAQVRVNHTNGSNASLSLDGSIVGDITGIKLTTGAFGCEDARKFALNTLERSKSAYESGVYGVLARPPSTYSYNVNEDANKVDFSFEFRDPFSLRDGDVLHEYSVSVEANKDSNAINVSIQGSFLHDGPFDLFDGGNIELGAKYLKIKTSFDDFDPYLAAFKEYSGFLSFVDGYEDAIYLNPNSLSENVTKNPFSPQIDYNYTFDNRIDYGSGDLKNLGFTINDSLPIVRTRIDESNNGYANQEAVSRTLGRISISAQAQENASKLAALSGVCGQFLVGRNCQIYENNWNTGDSSISYNISSYY